MTLLIIGLIIVELVGVFWMIYRDKKHEKQNSVVGEFIDRWERAVFKLEQECCLRNKQIDDFLRRIK